MQDIFQRINKSLFWIFSSITNSLHRAKSWIWHKIFGAPNQTTVNVSGIGDKRLNKIAGLISSSKQKKIILKCDAALDAKKALTLAKAINKNPNVEVLDLSNFKMPTLGLQCFIRNLPSQIKTINLSNAEIGGTDARAIADLIKTNTNLTTIILDGVEFHTNTIGKIVTATNGRTTRLNLKLDGNRGDNAIMLHESLSKHLSPDSRINTLSIVNNSGVDGIEVRDNSFIRKLSQSTQAINIGLYFADAIKFIKSIVQLALDNPDSKLQNLNVRIFGGMSGSINRQDARIDFCINEEGSKERSKEHLYDIERGKAFTCYKNHREQVINDSWETFRAAASKGSMITLKNNQIENLPCLPQAIIDNKIRAWLPRAIKVRIY